ncbi:hypothetical protein GCM10027425_02690 [Alteromonas gracilis]
MGTEGVAKRDCLPSVFKQSLSSDEQGRRRLGLGERVHRGPSDNLDLHQPTVTEAGQMRRHGRLSEPEVRGQVNYSVLAKRKVAQNTQSRRVT